MKGMILAAGFGTRFRPATFEIPKPMVPLCNKPLIDYAVESLLRAGVSDVVVNLHHLPDLLRAHLERRFSRRCRVHFSHEEEILGTGGGIRRARELLEGDDAFFLVNGDTIQFPPLDQLEKIRAGRDAVAALLLRHPPEGDRFTSVFFENGAVTGFGEGSGEALMFSGSHSISRRIFDLLPDRDFSGITEDVYIPLLRSGEVELAGLVHDGPWFDIGTPLRYRTASEQVKNLMIGGSIGVPDGSRVDHAASALISNDAEAAGTIESTIVGRARVARGATVHHSVLWDDSEVKPSARISDSILCGGVSIPAGATVGNAMVAAIRPDIEYPEGTTVTGQFAAVPIDPGSPLVLDFR